MNGTQNHNENYVDYVLQLHPHETTYPHIY